VGEWVTSPSRGGDEEDYMEDEYMEDDSVEDEYMEDEYMDDNYAVSRGAIGTSDPVGPVPALDDTLTAGDSADGAAAGGGGWSDVRASDDTANNAVRRSETDSLAGAYTRPLFGST